jgi:hypothetical protein
MLALKGCSTGSVSSELLAMKFHEPATCQYNVVCSFIGYPKQIRYQWKQSLGLIIILKILWRLLMRYQHGGNRSQEIKNWAANRRRATLTASPFGHLIIDSIKRVFQKRATKEHVLVESEEYQRLNQAHMVDITAYAVTIMGLTDVRT